MQTCKHKYRYRDKAKYQYSSACIYMHTCMHAYMYICMIACLGSYTCILTFLHACVHMQNGPAYVRSSMITNMHTRLGEASGATGNMALKMLYKNPLRKPSWGN